MTRLRDGLARLEAAAVDGGLLEEALEEDSGKGRKIRRLRRTSGVSVMMVAL